MLDYKYTLPLDSASSDLSTTGGKGHNLGILSRNGGGNIPVPGGFTVTVAAYRDFVAENNLRQKIQAALSGLTKKDDNDVTTTTVANTAQLEQVSLQIRNDFRAAKVSKALSLEIKSRLDSLIPNASINLAVRSSATCEDMPDASFAGQHDTYLNVKRSNVDNVCSHVVDCFSSLFTSRAIAYRQRNGISHLDAGMAVVVQELVAADCSGVLFTANPLSGRRHETILEAIPGLGEALVSGLTEPDRYVISRNNSSDSDGSSMQIKDVRVGAKLTAIRPTQGGGVAEETKSNDDTKAETTVLTDDEVKELVELGQRIEALFGGAPQDIEWAKVHGKTFQVVQSRPITTLFPCPNISPDRPLQVFFSFGAIQGIASPFFPAGSDAIRDLMGGLIRYVTWGRKGTGREFLQVVAERLYLNVTPVWRNSIGRKFWGKALAAVEPSIKNGIEQLLPDIPVTTGMTPIMFLRLASIFSIVIPRFLYTFAFPQHSREALVRMMNDRIASIQKEADKATTLAQVVDVKEKSFRGFMPFALFRFIPRFAAGMSPLYLLNHLASSVPNGKNLVLTITRGLPHNVTTEMDLELWQVAKTIRSNDEAQAFVRNHDVDVLADAYLDGKLPSVAQDTIGSFLDVYGVRGLYEIDFGRPRWREEPAALFQTIKSYMEIDEENAPDRVFAKGEVAAKEAIEQLGKEIGKPWLVRFLAHRTRTIAGVRELPKFTMIRIMGIMRPKYLEQGELLVKSGTLDGPRDVFYLLDDELRSLAAGDARDWKALVADRKAAMEKENARTAIPRVIASDGFAFFGGAGASSYSEGDNAFVGEPVSPGSVEGIVHVVYDPSKSSLKPGEILVCHGTDPSWTPLFLAAGGLVMEVGGLMTHGSVVAREYGIPAVVGLEKITERLQTGQRIRVDGSSGVVSILEQDGEE